jgi:hypothetical protein
MIAVSGIKFINSLHFHSFLFEGGIGEHILDMFLIQVLIFIFPLLKNC